MHFAWVNSLKILVNFSSWKWHPRSNVYLILNAMIWDYAFCIMHYALCTMHYAVADVIMGKHSEFSSNICSRNTKVMQHVLWKTSTHRWCAPPCPWSACPPTPWRWLPGLLKILPLVLPWKIELETCSSFCINAVKWEGTKLAVICL